jgi:uncharacterized protein (TIGR03118 family)
MRRRRIVTGLVASLGLVAAMGAMPVAASAQTSGNSYQQTNLVSDQPGHAAITDPNLVNAWGMSHGPNTPLWVSDNGADVSTLYRTDMGAPVTIVPLVVGIPGGAPTGQVFNDTTGFVVPGTGKPAAFIFAGENGDLSAWNGGTEAVHVGGVAGGVFKGLALVHSPFGPFLLVANFHDNRIEIFDSKFRHIRLDFLFRDPFIPKGFAPFNVAEIGNRVFVSYAKQDADRHDDVAGPGNGFIDVFTNFGLLVKRFASRGVLNSPWGMTIAPANFGAFSNDLLVGNFGNGRIHAFDPRTGRLLGTLRDARGHVIVIDGLWGLIVGDPAAGGTDAVWFSAGPDEEAHGLLGTLRAS